MDDNDYFTKYICAGPLWQVFTMVIKCYFSSGCRKCTPSQRNCDGWHVEEKASQRDLSVTVASHMFSVWNNQYNKSAYIGAACSQFLHCMT